MGSYGVSKDIPQNITVTVDGVIAISPPKAYSQQNSTNAPPGQILESYAAIAANSTGTQASGTVVPPVGIITVTSAGSAYSVTLPVSVPGTSITIVTTTATNTVAVFPNAGGTTTEVINALSANAAITMAAKTRATFVCAAAGQWYTVPLLPS